MPADPDVVSLVTNDLLTGTAAGHLRRERFADAAASNLIAGMNHTLEKGRQLFSMVADLILYRVADGLTGADSPIGEGILLNRSVQGQPNQRTMDDPAWRQAPPPPKQSGA